MKTLAPHTNFDLIERMRVVFDNVVLISLLEEFLRSLQSTGNDLDEIPQDCMKAVRFLSIKLRGTASEYGANRFAEIARTMEHSLKQSTRNTSDWRLLLRAEINETIGTYRRMIQLLRCMPVAEHGPKLVSCA